MPDATTANLALPLMAAAQAQKHVTHNEALVALDTLVQLAVLDKDLTAPPANPAEGDRYLIAGASPTGAWAGWAGRVVRYQDGAWRSFVPRPGWVAFVADEADLYTCTGVAWVSYRAGITVLQNLARLGIGTTADANNPFAAKLNKALWTALTAGEGGSGDLRYTLNKEAPGNTLSLLFQSGFSGRAELGLAGDDDLRLKVSADGGTWREALRIDRATGGLDLVAAEISAPVAATVDLGALPALKVALTGAGTITGFGTGANRVRLLRFTGSATLTHNAASLALPGGATIMTASGDTALATSDASGNWTVRDYVRASGKPIAGPAVAEIQDASASGRSVLTGTPASGATALGLGTGGTPRFAGLRLANTDFVAGSAGSCIDVGANAGSGDTAYKVQAFTAGGAGSGDLALNPAGGGVGIGTASPAYGLHVAGTFGATGTATFGAAVTIGGALTLNNGTSNLLTFGNVGIAPPSVSTRSAGTKILLYSNLTSTNADFAIGIDASTLWNSLPRTTDSFKWYGGTAIAASLTGAGVFTTTGSITAAGVVSSTRLRPGSYTVATVPTGVAGDLIYVSNARKVGEASGAGTGVLAYYSSSNWRRLSDDGVVAA
ncbi:DUF2793 domain-containing protein [Methylobacterium sp. 17Sr1-1]|uniref:DUF2793 domain-containing protein n=1 Tax=Methylobacterium sp. 17Sr1-1 TaxID=2202826 RepID=UPI001FDFD404|nr:DUF2793 domain-containing protein [Methylobacterium sp. 17Sr1-1]